MSEKNQPSHNVYTNIGGHDNKVKIKIGAAWKHTKGDGFNIQLNALPIGGSLVVFPVTDANDEKD